MSGMFNHVVKLDYRRYLKNVIGGADVTQAVLNHLRLAVE
jgi:hypothetical protein